MHRYSAALANGWVVSEPIIAVICFDREVDNAEGWELP